MKWIVSMTKGTQIIVAEMDESWVPHFVDIHFKLGWKLLARYPKDDEGEKT